QIPKRQRHAGFVEQRCQRAAARMQIVRRQRDHAVEARLAAVDEGQNLDGDGHLEGARHWERLVAIDEQLASALEMDDAYTDLSGTDRGEALNLIGEPRQASIARWLSTSEQRRTNREGG